MDLNVENIKCRLCDTKTDPAIEIYGSKGVKLSIASILSKHLTVEINEKDPFSKIVCKKCWRITDQFHKLYCSVEKVSLKQKMLIDKQCGNPVPITLLVPDRSIKKEEFFTDDSKPDVENFDNVDSESENVGDDWLKIEHYVKDESTEENDPVPANTVKVLKSNKSKKRCKNSDIKIKKNNTSDSECQTKKALKVVEQDKEISSFLGITCEICHVTTDTFLELLQHFRIDHRIVGYLRCCERKYFRRHKLYDHILNHSCPDRYKCHMCGRSYLDKDFYEHHIKTHDPAAKSFHCNSCPKRYDSKRLLDIHFIRTHDIAPKPFICDICSKNFISKNAVATHLLSKHTEHCPNICDVCAKVFRTRLQLNRHYKANHMGIEVPKVQCTICGSWLSNPDSLRKHILRHEAKQETCPVCGKLCRNKDALYKHTQNVHSGRQFPCHMCEKIFKSQITLKEHIAIHTGYSIYKCPYCSMEFKSNANMYKHRKNAHPIEYQKDQGKRLNMKL